MGRGGMEQSLDNLIGASNFRFGAGDKILFSGIGTGDTGKGVGQPANGDLGQTGRGFELFVGRLIKEGDHELIPNG